MNWNPRDVATIVRDAVQVYYDLQNQNGELTLIQELEQEAAHGLKAIQTLVDEMAKQQRIWISNGMTEKLTDPDADFGTLYNQERWREIKVLFDDFGVWLRTPLVVQAADEGNGIPLVAVPPLVIISRRGNPTPTTLTPAATPRNKSDASDDTKKKKT